MWLESIGKFEVRVFYWGLLFIISWGLLLFIIIQDYNCISLQFF